MGGFKCLFSLLTTITEALLRVIPSNKFLDYPITPTTLHI